MAKLSVIFVTAFKDLFSINNYFNTAYAVHKVTRAFIAQMLMKDFDTQESVVSLDLKKPSNNVNAGKILVRIKIALKSRDNYAKFGRRSIAANILKW